jgi:hypothetical protein
VSPGILMGGSVTFRRPGELGPVLRMTPRERRELAAEPNRIKVVVMGYERSWPLALSKGPRRTVLFPGDSLTVNL